MKNFHRSCYYSLKWALRSPFHKRIYRDISFGEILFLMTSIGLVVFLSVNLIKK